jgi:hypothetical protein
MMTKPPGFASSSTLPMDEEDEESIDESLDEILLEANEKPQENSAKSLEAVPSSLNADDDDDPDIFDSAPISAGGTARTASPQSEITVIAPRPTFADDEVKEETKVDPYETAIRAAATRDEPLTSQASHQRERALRRATPSVSASASRQPARAALAEVEFEDPETTGDYASAPHGADASERTPADAPDVPMLADDSAPSPAGGYPSPASGYMPRLPPPGRPSPPPGRPDIYPGRRIPTPSSDFLPAPAVGFGSGAHYPSIAIPAPSAQDSSARTSAALADNRVRLPVTGLAVFLVTAFGGGLLVGAMLWRGRAASGSADMPVVTHVVSKTSVEPIQPIVVKPVPPPSAPVAVAPSAPAVAVAAPAPAAAAAAPSLPTLAAETPAVTDTPPPPVEKPKKAKAKKTTTLDEDLAAVDNDAPPPPPKAKKKKTVWQDPFAQ